MTRIVSKFGIAAALTLGMFSTAAAQRTTTSTTKVPVTKETTSPGEVVRVDTVRVHDTVTVAGPTVYRRDTLTVTGATITRYDTTKIEVVPGWMAAGNGLYFGLGAGSYYPSGGLGGGQIPGYAFQANLGVDPAGSPLGFRLTAGLARPDEEQIYGSLGGRPEVVNLTGDLKLRLPVFKSTSFRILSLYGVGGAALAMYKDLRMEDESKTVVLADHNWHDAFGWNAGGGVAANLGHGREAFAEIRAINFMKSGFENGHQVPLIIGLNWY